MSMLENPGQKYRPSVSFCLPDRTWPDVKLVQPPIWCSVDLRDGNQALIEPMDIDRKMRMFKMLLNIGFREIEVGFPSASQLDFDFIRKIIDEDLVPNGIAIQVLTQARRDLIERTFQSLKGAKRAIVHFYNATAPVMRKVVFGLDKNGIKDISVTHAKIIKEFAELRPETEWIFQYSPEMFSSTEIEFAKDVCDDVIDVFQPTPTRPMIINLPSTVECMSPNVFADQIEWMHRNISKRDSIVLSIHPHNDRGTGTAAAELSLMAGADRLEGCLFGNGERTGNLDIVNVALNMYVQGVHPGLNFSNIDEIRATVEHCNQLPVPVRHPYVGDLVFTSFSGSHQDAIKKAFAARSESDYWDMPYLPIDPKDLGRDYEAIIRVNSQSGKGGVSYLLEAEYGIKMPKELQVEFSKIVQAVADDTKAELTASDIWSLFKNEYIERPFKKKYESHRILGELDGERQVTVAIEFSVDSALVKVNGVGNGPIDAVVHGLCKSLDSHIQVIEYYEHSIGSGSDATAACFIKLSVDGCKPVYGVGIHPDIISASIHAIFSGLDRVGITG
jgi:2-isopropylmalate synthase